MKLLTVWEAAEKYNIKPSRIRGWIHRRVVPYKKKQVSHLQVCLIHPRDIEKALLLKPGRRWHKDKSS